MTKDDFISIWGSRAAFARAIGKSDTTVRAWFQRGSIPFRYDDSIILAAARKGRGITPTDLHQLRRSLLQTRGVAA